MLEAGSSYGTEIHLQYVWSSLFEAFVEKQIFLLFSFCHCMDLCLVSILKLWIAGIFRDEQHISDTSCLRTSIV